MPLDKSKILYVEDDDTLREVMSELLSDIVGELHIAQDGEKGLELFEKHNPDVVISDIYMPHMDGLKMSEIIKERYPEQPVVLLTAFTNAVDLKRAIEIGIDRYINKPIQTIEQIEKPLGNIVKRIDEQKKLIELSHTLEHESKYAAMGEIIGHITHQWRQPLGVISSYMTGLQLAQEFGEMTDEKIDTAIKATQDQILFLSNTINDFRDYLRPSETPKPFKLEGTFKKVESLLGSVLRLEGIKYQFPQTDLQLQSIENKLVHVILNLMNNARDAINANKSEVKIIEVEVTSSENSVHITISDSGGGIPQDLEKKIFDAYFTTKEKETGTGLGLYMVREFIVGSLQGSIDVENKETECLGEKFYGAVFTISIPLQMETGN